MTKKLLASIQKHLDIRPLLVLLLMYGLIQWLPFGIFGWLQNEDGLMEWGSVALIGLSAYNASRLLTKAPQTSATRIAWIVFILFCLLFIGEEISWGERLHGFGIESIRAINTQGETNLHNISHFQNTKGLLHLGWAGLGLVLGLGSWLRTSPSPLLPDRRLCLYFLIPAFWYVGFELRRKNGSCPLTIANHQEIYEFLVAVGLFLHTRLWCRRLGLLKRATGA